MNHAREHLTSALLVALLFVLQSCYAVPMAPQEGEILPLSIEATARGLEAARNGAPLTYAITDPAQRITFYLWQMGQIIGGACLNCGVKDPVGQFNFLAQGRGMAMTGKTAGEIVHDLVQNYGWQEIPAGMAGLGRSAVGLANSMANSLTGFQVIPASVFDERLPEVY
jgi:hypothetical protein